MIKREVVVQLPGSSCPGIVPAITSLGQRLYKSIQYIFFKLGVKRSLLSWVAVSWLAIVLRLVSPNIRRIPSLAGSCENTTCSLPGKAAVRVALSRGVF